MGALEKLWSLTSHGLGEADGRTKNLFLMNSAWSPLILLVIFLIICYYIGPYYMARHDQPFEVYYYLVWHNIFLVVTNMFFGLSLLLYMFIVDHSLLCQPVGTKYKADNVIAYLLYGLFLLKIFELIDALILIAKKQCPPFILVFHHTTIVIVMWISVKYGPGGSAVFPTMLNSFVHVMVYLHFKYSNRFMTKEQAKKAFMLIYVIQFSLIALSSSTTIYLKCGYPITLAVISLSYNGLLILVYSRTMWELWCHPMEPDDYSSSSSSGDDCSDDSDDDGDGDGIDDNILDKNNNNITNIANSLRHPIKKKKN